MIPLEGNSPTEQMERLQGPEVVGDFMEAVFPMQD